MPKFKIYAGLSGGFGGAIYQGTYKYDTIEKAEDNTYTLTIEEYESLCRFARINVMDRY